MKISGLAGAACLGLALAAAAGAQGTWVKAPGQPFAAPGAAFEHRAGYPVYRLAAGAGKALFAAGPAGLHRRADAGAAWSVAASEAFAMSNALAADASGLVLYNKRVSRDGGLTFVDLPDAVTVIPTAFAVRQQVVVTGGYYNIILGSRDAARTFTRLRSGPDVAHPTALEVAASGRLYSGLFTGGLFFSDDQGRTWSNHLGSERPPTETGFIPAGARDMTSLEILPDGRLLAGYFGMDGSAGTAGLFLVSADLKEAAAVAGGFPRFGVTDLVRGPAGSLFAATWGSGVWVSRDGGSAWSALDAGPGGRHILALAIDSEASLHALTREGLFTLAKAEGGGTSLGRPGSPRTAGLQGIDIFDGRFRGSHRIDGRLRSAGRNP